MTNGEPAPLARLAEELGSKTAAMWLDTAQVRRARDGHAILCVEDPFQKRWLEDHGADAVRAVLGDGAEIRAPRTGPAPAPRPVSRAKPQLRGAAGEYALRIVRGWACHERLHAALVVVHGAPRSGKSCLLDWAASLAGRSVFALDVDRLRAGSGRDLVPRKPLLVVDGIDRLAGRAAAQQALARILDAVVDRGDRALVSVAGHPALAPGLEPCLRNRLAGGLLVPLEAPGPGQVRAMLRASAHGRGRRLPRAWEDELCRLPADDAVARLAARFDGRPEDEAAGPLARLKDAAARVFSVERALLDGPGKRRGLVEARRAVMAAAAAARVKEAEIAAAFGLKSGRAVREGVRWARAQAERDPSFGALLHEVRRVLTAR